MTGKQMCETIAWVTGYEGDPQDIWKSNSRGELFHVFAAFEAATAWIAREFDPGSSG